MARYLLDTNHLGAALDARSTIRERLYQALAAGHQFGTCVPVLCELGTGLQHTRRRDHNRRVLAILLRKVRIWPLKPAIAQFYAEIFHHLRENGRVLSQVDILLGALSRSLNATVLSADRDFDAVTGLRVENWLSRAVAQCASPASPRKSSV
jgi:predicted nucleic acid-binding protein